MHFGIGEDVGRYTNCIRTKFGRRLQMKKGWPLFKMQLQACLFSLRVNGMLEDTFDQELPPQQDTVLDETDSTHASQGDTRKANTKVM